MLDNLFLKKYDFQKYNCCDFVIDAYKIIQNVDLSCVLNWRKIENKSRNFFKREKDIRNKTLLCFMSNKIENHIGILYNNKILHLRCSGVEYQPIEIATRHFNKIRYYSCRE